MARLLLLQPGLGRYYRGAAVGLAVTRPPPLSLAVLAAVARAAGHRVRVRDLETHPIEALDDDLDGFRPDVVGITFRTPQRSAALALARRVEARAPGAVRVAGGPHASSLPEDTLDGGAFQVAIRGEGEIPLLALLDGRPPRDVPGAATPGRPAPQPAPPADLDALPPADWSGFDLERYRRFSLVAPASPVADLETSRGCPSGCITCTRAVFGRGFRERDPARTAEEARVAVAAGFRAFNLVDDAFNTRLDHAVATCEALLERGPGVPWTCTNGLRVAPLDASFLALARRSGLALAAFGLESGSDRILRAMGKGTTAAQGREAVRLARRAGITTVGYFLLGLPGETPETLRETLDFALSLDLDWAKFSLAMPLPGTDLARRWAHRLDRPYPDDLSIHRPAADWFEHPELPWPALEHARRRATRAFYARPRQAVRVAARLLGL